LIETIVVLQLKVLFNVESGAQDCIDSVTVIQKVEVVQKYMVTQQFLSWNVRVFPTSEKLIIHLNCLLHCCSWIEGGQSFEEWHSVAGPFSLKMHDAYRELMFKMVLMIESTLNTELIDYSWEWSKSLQMPNVFSVLLPFFTFKMSSLNWASSI
jgi:hypothetical protein